MQMLPFLIKLMIWLYGLMKIKYSHLLQLCLHVVVSFHSLLVMIVADELFKFDLIFWSDNLIFY